MAPLTKALANARDDEAAAIGEMQRVEKRLAADHPEWRELQVWDAARKTRDYQRAYAKQVAASRTVTRLRGQGVSQPAGTSPPLPRSADVVAKIQQLFSSASFSDQTNPQALLTRIFALRADEVGVRLSPNNYNASDWRRLHYGALLSLCQQNEAQ